MRSSTKSIEHAETAGSHLNFCDMLQAIFGVKPKTILPYEFSKVRESQIEIALTSTLIINCCATMAAIISLIVAQTFGSSQLFYQWFLAISVPFLINFCMLWRCYCLQAKGRLTYRFFVGVHVIGGLAVGVIWGWYPLALSQTLALPHYLVEAIYMCTVMCGLAWGFPLLQPALVMVTSMTFSYLYAIFFHAYSDAAPFVLISSLVLCLYFILMGILAVIVVLFIRWTQESIQANQRSHMLNLFLKDFEDSATDWIWQTNDSGYLDYVSKRLISLTGLEAGQLEKMKLIDLLMQNNLEAQQLEKYLSQEKQFLNFKVPVLIQGEPTWWSLTGKPVLDEFGKFSGFRGVGSDISKEVEMSKIESDREYYEAFIKISSSLSHDFNNLLASVMIRLEFIKNDKSIKHTLKEYADEGLYICKKAANITSQMLAYSRKHSLYPKNVSVNAIVNMLKEEISGQGQDISITVNSTCDCYVWSDETLLYTSLTNIMNNAVRALSGRGCIHININHQQIVKENYDLAPGDYVHISIEDTGAGFTPQELINGQAFEPFYTNNRDAGGSGLGLSMVHGFTRQSGGNVFISNGQHGAKVDLYLLAGEKEDSHVESLEQLNQDLHILLVEDNKDVGLLLIEYLQTLGHKVYSAASLAEVKTMFTANRQINLIISDFILPDGNGSDVSQFVRSINPNVAFMFISGFLDVPLGSESNKDIVLVKPFTLAELSKTIDIVIKNKTAK